MSAEIISLVAYGFAAVAERMGWEAVAFRLYTRSVRLTGLAKAHYRIGFYYQRNGDLEAAARHLRLAVTKGPARAHWYGRLGRVVLDSKEFSQAMEAFEEALALESEPQKAERAFQIGRSLYDYSRFADAEAFLSRAIRFNPIHSAAWALLGRARDAMGSTALALNAFEQAVTLNPESAEIHYALGWAAERMGWLEVAGNAYRRAINLRSEVGEWHYRLGLVLEQLGRVEEAGPAYAQASRLAERGEGPEGTALLHEKHGQWLRAVAAWQRAVSACSDRRAGLYFRLGLAHERCHQWDAAAEAYRNALAIDATEADWHFRRGVVLERAERWEEAAAAYEAALARMEGDASECHYRLGTVLARAGRQAGALEAFRWARAPVPSSLDSSAGGDFTQEAVADYILGFEQLPLRDKCVLYECHQGAYMGCNPYAIFRYVLDHPDFRGWTHVWVLNDKTRLPEDLRARSDVIVVRHGTALYRRYLCTARYLVNNAAFPSYFMRREGQYYLNTWHGTPVKTLGKDIVQPFMEHENGTRNFLHATHIISPNAHTTRVLRERYDLDGLYGGVLAETGYPRIDLTLNASETERQALKQAVGIELGRPVVLYAPTWRGALGRVAFDAERVAGDLDALGRSGAVVLFRGHHLVESIVAEKAARLRVVPATVDTNELLGIVDVLVTDYSSIAIDFFATGRPLIHYLYDHAEYRQQRGLYFEPDELPGRVCYHIHEVAALLDELLNEPSANDSDAMALARQRFCPYDDGSATRRVVDLFLRGKPSAAPPKEAQRKAVLLFAGDFSSERATQALCDHVRRAEERGYRPVVVVDPREVEAESERKQRFARLRRDIAVLGRCDAMDLTREERAVLQGFELEPELVEGQRAAVYRRAYRREFYRLFGKVDFAEVINLEADSLYWASLFAFGPGEGATRLVCCDEPAPRCISDLYPYYTRGVSTQRELPQGTGTLTSVEKME